MASIGVRREKERPPISMLPASGSWTPEITLMRVDLPEPFSPARQWISPAPISRLTPLSACTPPKDLTIPWTLRTGIRHLEPPRPPGIIKSAGGSIMPRPRPAWEDDSPQNPNVSTLALLIVIQPCPWSTLVEPGANFMLVQPGAFRLMPLATFSPLRTATAIASWA